jgi:hypothetical protein
MHAVFSMEGDAALNARLDQIAVIVANPITREALTAGGNVIKAEAEALVRRLTGTLAGDVIVVTRILSGAQSADNPSSLGEKYVLIGPGWNPEVYRRVAKSRAASNREATPDYTTNPGIYGYFLEVGHRAPGKGLAHDNQYLRDARLAKKQGHRLNTYTDPSSRSYGTLTVPPYPWLKPAFDNKHEEAFEVMADVIRTRLEALGISSQLVAA